MANIIFSEFSGAADSVFGKSQAPIQKFIEDRANLCEENSVVGKLFDMNRSKHYGEKITGMTAPSGFEPVGENGAYPIDGIEESYSSTFEHVTWKDRFDISREMVEDSKLMDLRKKPQSFINGFYRTREELGAALFGGAVTKNTAVTFRGHAFDIKAADGLTYFNTAHTSKISSATQSNLFSDAFSTDALSAAECKMQGYTGDNDDLLAVAPNCIIIPNDYSLKKAVFAAIGSDKDPATANNGFNYQYGRWTVIVWAYLNRYITAGTSPWIIGDLGYNSECSGAVWFDRTPLEVRSTVDDNNDANVWRGYARFTAGFHDWRAFACGGVTGGSTLISE